MKSVISFVVQPFCICLYGSSWWNSALAQLLLPIPPLNLSNTVLIGNFQQWNKALTNYMCNRRHCRGLDEREPAQSNRGLYFMLSLAYAPFNIVYIVEGGQSAVRILVNNTKTSSSNVYKDVVWIKDPVCVTHVSLESPQKKSVWKYTGLKIESWTKDVYVLVRN